MPAAIDTLDPALARELEQVVVRTDGCTAVVDGHKLEANTPRHLSIYLRWALYEFLHSGRPADMYKNKDVERDAALEARLTEAIPHRNSVTSARVHERRDGELLVTIDGTRVRVPVERVVTDAPYHGDDVVYLAMPAARPALSPGFFLTDGSRGRSVRKPTLRLYVNLESLAAAEEAWRLVLNCLEDRGVPYRLKVASSPHLVPRRDALVAYLGPESWDAVAEVASCVVDLPGRGSKVSVFAEQVAPGVSVAWQPFAERSGGQTGRSFGQHRATAVAEGLVGHVLGTRAGTREEAVAGALFDAGVDPSAPYRNLDSPQIGFDTVGSAR
ncbi:T3SS effector HopA1 family protein [Streptomyces scopuliridis]|uniref:Uncharacterized protein n=2 Tax=Streptomyces scopuliridis TaxID=452529 RepID=A0A2T7T6E3_9ACTN|nr:T3SS effector HopA1 family protein [Streptomyces scopuliridis]PVE10733.1 hypothetical protein Y717_26075 [Streptomyces scopuliridis RB72]WSC02360.1 T3SS effector HopA1 family protein [Streptomyces scopuliridis]WSC04103.1 T3SS effector HopA1 family protein [Streptomyces scopuliridis]